MYDILRQYAVENVWCSPPQDNQIILSAKRITRKGGDIVSTPIMSRRVQLPENKKYYHVFQVGQVHPALLGLLPNKPEWAIGQWKRFDAALNSLPVFVDIYTDSGVHIPLYKTYYMHTADRAFVFCVEINKVLDINYEDEQVYLRLYSNEFYNSIESSSLAHNTRTAGRTIYTNTDIIQVQSIENSWKQETGAVFSYVNGHLVHEISPFTTKAGDYVECVHDSSVKRVVDLRVNDLKVFQSELDDVAKYLLHYPETTDQIIDYVDDIDVYVLSKDGNRFIGRYIHKNQAETLRMVTYRDYSLYVDVYRGISEYLAAYLNDTAMDLRDFYVRLYIRNSGFNRPLVYDNERLFELYKLNDEDVLQALIGVDAVVPNWTAVNLENSEFIKLLSKSYNDINIDTIEKAFGYNAISKVLADSPLNVYEDAGSSYFDLPPGLQNNSTIYEYDENGVLLGWSHHLNGALHISSNPLCKMIDGVVGLGEEEPSVIYGVNNIVVNPDYSYKVYMCYVDNDSNPSTPWVDITGDDSFYHVVNNVITWVSTDESYLLMVRTDERFVSYEFELLPIAGTLYFTMTEMVNGLERPCSVPMGDYDLWLNGKELTRGLDYVFDFPKVYITNKDYLIQPAGSTPQKITVRATGFSRYVDGKYILDPIADYGFIEHGVLSNNNRYDIRDDKVLRIVVKGCLKNRDELIFSEEHQGVSVTNSLNGQPYQIKDPLIPLRGLTYTKTLELKDKSEAIDKIVGDYMSIKLPQPERNAPSSIQSRHRLCSPFFTHIVNDLASGQFNMESIRKNLTDGEVLDICKDYEYLLKFDPLNEDLGIDYRFVLIHPHQLETTIPLDVYSYSFMKKVVKLYGKNLVTLSGHLNINAENGEN